MVGYVVANHPVPVKIEKNQKTSLVKKFQKGHIYIPKMKGFDIAFLFRPLGFTGLLATGIKMLN